MKLFNVPCPECGRKLFRLLPADNCGLCEGNGVIRMVKYDDYLKVAEDAAELARRCRLMAEQTKATAERANRSDRAYREMMERSFRLQKAALLQLMRRKNRPDS